MASIARRRNRIRVALSPEEARVLAGFAEEVAAMVAPPAPAADADPLAVLVGLDDTPVAASEDPAVARLLPDAYTDDPEGSAEFRRLMDGDLRRRKVAALTALAGTLREATPPLELTDTAAESWLQAVNDIRLVLGTRLEVTDDGPRQSLPTDDPRAPLVAAYDWLTWMQERLLRSLPEPSA